MELMQLYATLHNFMQLYETLLCNYANMQQLMQLCNYMKTSYATVLVLYCLCNYMQQFRMQLYATMQLYVLEDWLLSLMSTLVMGFGPQD
jgi:hypothetical protein